MALHLEVRLSDGQWQEIGRVTPGAPPGSMSNITETGKRELYLFECAGDDSESRIQKSEAGIDREVGQVQRLVSSLGLRLMATLKEGDDPFELDIKTERSPTRIKFRFSHKKGDQMGAEREAHQRVLLERSARLTPQDLIIMAFSYFKTEELSFESLLNIMVASVWGYPEEPPKVLFERMASNLMGLIRSMMEKGLLSERDREGEKIYKLENPAFN